MSGVPSISAPAASSLIGGPSVSGIMASPSGPPKRLKNDKSSKKNNVRPAAIQQARTGYTRLISVNEFRQNFLELERQLDKDLPAAEAAIDTSIEDVKVETPFQAIERAITMELARQGSSPDDEKKLAGSGDSIMDQYGMLTLPVAIPELKALQDPLIPLKKKRRKQIGKLVRKELNCMTEKTLQTEIEDRTKTGHVVPLRDREVILKVAVYHPHLYNKSQEFLVLGSQPLTALRERILCHSDEELDGAQSPSAFFFIENKFYNDTRDRRAIKYSDPIINWVKSEDRYTHPGLSHFEARTMQDVTFNDLSIRLGSHYLYQHQGECKHVIMFTDLRMAHNLDVQNAIAYPIKVFQSKTRRKKCRVCDLFAAKMVTYSDRLAHENPFFWCEQCYKLYHYNAQGVILYSDFQVYPYTGHE